MTDLQRRPTNLRRSRDVRRLVIALALIVTASLMWQGARDYAVRELAESSLGCGSRADLIAAAIWHRYPALRMETPYGLPLVSYRSAATAGAACEVRSVTERLPTGTSLGHEQRYAVVNANLDLVGVIVGSSLPLLPTPGDRDADGCIETVTSCIPDIGNLSRSAGLWATARLGPDSNEVAALVLVDYTPWRAAKVWIRPEWGSQNADGRQELLFLAWSPGRLPSGRMGFLPPETLAVFEWNHPGGVLRPTLLPNDGSFLVWTLPDGKPYPFSPDECVDDVARKLLPIPDDFGVPATAPAASQPATSTTQAPASQPAPPLHLDPLIP
jgi:hypothetical protein